MSKERKLLFFSKGETCEPCKEVQDYLNSRGVRGYSKINPFEEIDLSIQHNVKTVPTLILIEDEKILKRVVGCIGRNINRFNELIRLYNE